MSTPVNTILDTSIQFGIQPFTPYTVSAASSEVTDGYAKENIHDLDQSSKWRTTAAGAQSITLTLSSPPSSFTLYLYGGNFPTFNVTGTTGSQTGLELQQHVTSGIRKGWYKFTSWSGNMVITPTGTPDNSAAYYELAEVIIIPETTGIIIPSYGHQLPWNMTTFRPAKILTYDSGGRSAVNLGRRRSRIELAAQLFVPDDEESLHKIMQMDMDRPFVFIENLKVPTIVSRTTDTSRVYLVKRIAEFDETWTAEAIQGGIIVEEE